MHFARLCSQNLCKTRLTGSDPVFIDAFCLLLATKQFLTFSLYHLIPRAREYSPFDTLPLNGYPYRVVYVIVFGVKTNTGNEAIHAAAVNRAASPSSTLFTKMIVCREPEENTGRDAAAATAVTMPVLPIIAQAAS